jgi:hypothetical protein
MVWTLIIFAAGSGFQAGATVTAIPMATQELCKEAGEAAKSIVPPSEWSKTLTYTCVRNQ